jgi:hypothetical protein
LNGQSELDQFSHRSEKTLTICLYLVISYLAFAGVTAEVIVGDGPLGMRPMRRNVVVAIIA